MQRLSHASSAQAGRTSLCIALEWSFAIVNTRESEAARTVSRFNYHSVYGPPTHTALPLPTRYSAGSGFSYLTRLLAAGATTRPRSCGSLTSPTNACRSRFNISSAGKRVLRGSRGASVLINPRTGGQGQPGLCSVVFRRAARHRHFEPYRPEEVGSYVPTAGQGCGTTQSNDVFVDRKGLIYVIDRCRGLDILKFTAATHVPNSNSTAFEYISIYRIIMGCCQVEASQGRTRIIPIRIQDGDRGGSEEMTQAYSEVRRGKATQTPAKRVPGRHTLEGESV